MFSLWCRIHDRCENPRNHGFSNYGGRGIRLCSRWLCPETFIKDVLTALGEKPDGFSLDRVNNDGDYEPGNVRWASRTDQNNNTRGNRRIEFRGETKNLNQWEKHLGFPPDSLRHRLKRGWDVERAFTTPLKPPHQTRIEFRGEIRNLNQWEKHLGFPSGVLHHRLRLGWGVEKALTTPLKPPSRTRASTITIRRQTPLE